MDSGKKMPWKGEPDQGKRANRNLSVDSAKILVMRLRQFGRGGHQTMWSTETAGVFPTVGSTDQVVITTPTAINAIPNRMPKPILRM
jgi:hypothetical protein